MHHFPCSAPSRPENQPLCRRHLGAAYARLATVALLALGTTACGSTVAYGDPPQDDDSCSDDSPQTPLPKALTLRADERGTFVGKQLHLRAQLEGSEQYLLAEIEDGVVFVVATPKELLGPSRLLQRTPTSQLRIRVPQDPTKASRQVDVIDTSVPREPVIVATHPIAGFALPGQAAVASLVNDQLAFCYQLYEGTQPQLGLISFSDVNAPEEVEVLAGNNPCFDVFDGGAALGNHWVSWIEGDGYAVPQVSSYQWSAKGIDTFHSGFGWNAGGTHSYGNIVSGMRNSTTAVINTTGNWFLTFPNDGFGSSGPYHSFAFAGPKQLLTVTEDTAYFATPDGVHAYDISKPQAPVASDYHAEIDWAPLAVQFIALNDSQLVVADGEGQLYVIPRASSGPLEPARVFEGAPQKVPAAKPPCDTY